LTETIYPVLPLRDIVIFPNMIAPLFVGRIKSINALEAVMEDNKEIILLTQKKPSVEEPNKKDLYKTGTIGSVLQLLKLPDGTVKVLVEGKSRCIINQMLTSNSYLSAKVTLINEAKYEKENQVHQVNRLIVSFEQFVKLNGKINSDILSTISEITDAGILTDTVINHLLLNIEEKQSFLEIVEPLKRVQNLITKIDKEISILDSEKKVRSRVKKQMEKTQREYYLNERIKSYSKRIGFFRRW